MDSCSMGEPFPSRKPRPDRTNQGDPRIPVRAAVTEAGKKPSPKAAGAESGGKSGDFKPPPHLPPPNVSVGRQSKPPLFIRPFPLPSIRSEPVRIESIPILPGAGRRWIDICPAGWSNNFFRSRVKSGGRPRPADSDSRKDFSP
jgi:hypothetical protein